MSSVSKLVAGDPLHDLEIAEAMVGELEDYIVGDDLYRTVVMHTGRGDERLNMSGANLLTRLYQLSAQREQLPPELHVRADGVQVEADAIIYSLKTRFDERLHREMKARLDSLRWFLDESLSDPQRGPANYPFEIRNRQRIEEILKRIEPTLSDKERKALKSVDQRIRQLTHGCPFIWDETLESIYPRSPYWYLYVTP
jgi:hypothetical protein